MKQMKISGKMAGSDGPSHLSTPYEELAAAIVLQAVNDYIRVLRGMWSKKIDIAQKRKLVVEKVEIEQFFHSGWYETLTDIDPERLMLECRKKARAKMKAAIERDNRKKVKALLTHAE